MANTTFNPSDRTNVALSNGNLTALANATFGGARAILGEQTGKYYWEFTVSTWASSYNDAGLFTANIPLSPQTIGTAGAGSFYVASNGAILLNGGTISGNPAIGAPAAGNVIGCAVDLTANLGWYRLGAAGNWNGSGTANPATAAGGINIAAANVSLLFPGVLTGISGDGVTGNFGDSAFTGAVPAGFAAGWPGTGGSGGGAAPAMAVILA